MCILILVNQLVTKVVIFVDINFIVNIILLFSFNVDSKFSIIQIFCIDSNIENSDYLLLQQDHWLRKRNGSWEMKYPIKSNVMTCVKNGTSKMESLHKDSKTDMYHETSEEKRILSKIIAISPSTLNNSALKNKYELDDLVSTGRLWPFAEIDTNRKEYQLLPGTNCSVYKQSKTNNQHSVTVVIDATSWGFLIGEVEILVQEQEDVDSAKSQIELIAKELEFTLNEERGGKVLNYLKQHRPCAYNTYMKTFKSS